MQKEKSRKKIFYMGKKTAKWSLVILSALVIYTAPPVITSVWGVGVNMNQEFHLSFREIL
jgi:hypothetical protein